MLDKKIGFKKVSNFLTQEEVNIAKTYYDIRHFNNFKNFDLVQNNCADTAVYCDLLSETFLLQKKQLIEKETGLKLYPAYSYYRTYTRGSILAKHTDRPSCEISVTVMVDSDGTPWPFYLDGKAISLNPGDAVIYLGTELEHYREEFTGDYHTQTFLHYVNQEGPYKDHKFDKKAYVGISEW